MGDRLSCCMKNTSECIDEAPCFLHPSKSSPIAQIEIYCDQYFDLMLIQNTSIQNLVYKISFEQYDDIMSHILIAEA